MMKLTNETGAPKKIERTYRYTEEELNHLEYLKTDADEKIAAVGEPLSDSSTEEHELWLREVWLPEQLPKEVRQAAREDNAGAFDQY